MAPSTIEITQPQTHPSMVADPGAQTAEQVASANLQQERELKAQERQPRLQLRGGGIILDLCACFICCEVCKGCCEAIDDCCCC